MVQCRQQCGPIEEDLKFQYIRSDQLSLLHIKNMNKVITTLRKTNVISKMLNYVGDFFLKFSQNPINLSLHEHPGK